MYNWVVINNGEITEYHHDVPQNWRHVSNLAASAEDLEFMRSVGWWPVTTQTIDFDSNTHEIERFEYVLGATSVTATPILREKPVQPPHAQTPDIEKPLMDLATLQVELQRWRDALTADATEKLAKALISADQKLMVHVKSSVEGFFQKLASEPDLLGAVPTELIHQAVTAKMNEAINSVMGHGDDRQTIMENWWFTLRNQVENEFRSTAHRVQGDIFSEMQTQRILLRQALHALNIDSVPKSSEDWIRYERDIRLIATDWSQLPDVQATMDDATRQRWARYRQALRDIPQIQQAGGGVEWPEF